MLLWENEYSHIQFPREKSKAYGKLSSTQTKMSSPLFLDCLYCEEKYWEEDEEEEEEEDIVTSTLLREQDSPFKLEFDDNDDQLINLLSKENKVHFSESDLEANKSLVEARKEALDWMMRVNAHHNFSGVTLVLSVHYFDKMMMNFGYQKDRPWMTQLAAVACLSLASKIEETHVPLLSDLLVENKYTFDAKTIQRMELLILSTLEWKMYAVTPISFFEYLITRLKLKDHLHWEILHRCQSLILSAIVDPRYLCYVPSVLAVATMLLALQELGQGSKMENQMYLMDTFKLNKEMVEKCQKFIKELSSNGNHKAHKRERFNSIESPKNVLDAVFCEISKDLIILSSLHSSPEPPRKRSRITKQPLWGYE